MRYAEVAVDAPFGHDRTLSYSIPPELIVEPGQLVWVPLGTRPVQGMVFQLVDQPQVEVTKDIIAPVEPSTLVSSIGLDLARWISRYYLASLFESAALMLPPGFKGRVRSYVQPIPPRSDASQGLRPREQDALEFLKADGELREADLIKALGRGSQYEVRRLLQKGLIYRRWELPRPRVSYKYDSFVRLQALSEQAGPADLKSDKQKALYKALASSKEPIPVTLANKEFGASAVNALVDKGLAAQEWVRVDRKPVVRPSLNATGPEITLTAAQDEALKRVTSALEDQRQGVKRQFLLHGITGSGKTEVYLRALERSLKMGRRGIFLVPEISLTPQTVHRLKARFGDGVAIMHSQLSPGELFDQWWKIRDGHYDVVVGPRSALFAPVPELGIIVIDEEHEWTYKQQDKAPRYHTRTAALKLADLWGAVVVMGSATPDVETYFKAEAGRYQLLELPQRISVQSDGPRRSTPGLAKVEVRDMRQELKEGNRSIISRSLAEAVKQNLDRGEQTLLFLNRRGSATFIQCRDCGYVVGCRRCSAALTYHATDSRLVCHQCNRRSSLPRTCPQCKSPRIRYLGFGTQRVVDELGQLVPEATVLRWDRDTASAHQAHEKILDRFVRGEAQVLVGTQMIAKGLHVPNVTLVGVILADIGINLPDFRAGERSFQLLCQVAGRAGRGIAPGLVIIQTYSPDNFVIQAAAGQDYGLFYGKEIEFRGEQGNPPFNRLIHMVYVHTSFQACQREAQRMGRVLRQKAYASGLTDVDAVGPAPAYPSRVRGRYRWHLILRGRNLHAFVEEVPFPQGWTIDIDPVSVM